MSLQLTVMSLDFDAFSGPTTKKFTKNEITLGRSTRNDLVLDNPDVSQKHAKLRIVRKDGEATLVVTDLGSTNGTHVRNLRLAPKEEVSVGINERIRIGNFLIKPTYLNEDVNEDQDMDEREEAVAPIAEGKIIRMPLPIEAKREEETLVEEEEVKIEPQEIISIPARIEEPVVQAQPVVAQLKMVSPKTESTTSGKNMIRGKVGAHGDSLNFTAKQLLSLSGKVIHKGKPLEGVSINAGKLGSAVTDAEGIFTFNDITEGSTYNLTAFKNDFVFSGRATSGLISEGAEIEFTATQLFTIKGIVTHNGKPLEGAEVDGGTLGKVLTSVDGAYVFKGVPEGTDFALQVSKDGFLIQAA